MKKIFLILLPLIVFIACEKILNEENISTKTSGIETNLSVIQDNITINGYYNSEEVSISNVSFDIDNIPTLEEREKVHNYWSYSKGCFNREDRALFLSSFPVNDNNEFIVGESANFIEAYNNASFYENITNDLYENGYTLFEDDILFNNTVLVWFSSTTSNSNSLLNNTTSINTINSKGFKSAISKVHSDVNLNYLIIESSDLQSINTIENDNFKLQFDNNLGNATILNFDNDIEFSRASNNWFEMLSKVNHVVIWSENNEPIFDFDGDIEEYELDYTNEEVHEISDELRSVVFDGAGFDFVISKTMSSIFGYAFIYNMDEYSNPLNNYLNSEIVYNNSTISGYTTYTPFYDNPSSMKRMKISSMTFFIPLNNL